MKLDDNLFAYTAWLMRNTHVETETGLTISDGYKWHNYMWDKWLHNSDAGRQILNNEVRKNMNNNPDTTNMNNITTTITNPRAELDTVTFTFTQATNCVDGPSNDIETLVIEAKSSLGIDGDGGAFYVLKTQQWAVDDSSEISELVRRCERAIGAIV
jgi:hypothetical protein